MSRTDYLLTSKLMHIVTKIRKVSRLQARLHSREPIQEPPSRKRRLPPVRSLSLRLKLPAVPLLDYPHYKP